MISFIVYSELMIAFSLSVLLHAYVYKICSSYFTNTKISANILSTIHALILSIYSVCALSYLNQHNFEYVRTLLMVLVLPFSAGYFLVDMYVWLVTIRGTLLNKIITLAHHGCALFLLYKVYTTNVYNTYPFICNYVLLTEISTPFINFYHITKHYSVPAFVATINKYIVIFLFLTVRVIGLSVVTLIYLFSQKFRFMYFSCLSLFALLNCFWFAKIWRMSKVENT